MEKRRRTLLATLLLVKQDYVTFSWLANRLGVKILVAQQDIRALKKAGYVSVSQVLDAVLNPSERRRSTSSCFCVVKLTHAGAKVAGGYKGLAQREAKIEKKLPLYYKGLNYL